MSRASAPAPVLSVPAAARCKFKSAVLKIPHLDAVSARRDMDAAFHAVKGIEKHQNQYGKKNGKHHEYEQYGQAGKQKQQGFPGKQAQLSASNKSKTAEELPLRVDDRETIDDALMNDPARCKTLPSHGGSKRNSKKVSSTNITCKFSPPLTIVSLANRRAPSSQT